ncbi:MAG: TatD family hydrolase [bacterium]
MNLIDSHCHVQFRAYDADRREVVLRARDHKIGMILVGTTTETSKSAIETASWFGEGLWATVGLHPNYLSGEDYLDEQEMNAAIRVGEKYLREDFDEAAFLEMARNPKVVALGETGLDYFHFPEDINIEQAKERQREGFRAHIRVADASLKPVVVHSRNAHGDLIKLIDEEIAAGHLVKRGVQHCFTGTAEQAAECVARGFYIGFGGVITFPAKKSNPEVQESLWKAVRETPLESIIIETDAPYLAPNEMRGKRNEPDYVRFVAEKIAELKGISYEKVARATTDNAIKLFGLS